MTSERACGKMHLKASLERMGNLRFCVCARKRKPRLLVGTESNGAVYGSGLFCTSKYTGKDRKEGSESLREGGWGVGVGGICCRPFDCHCLSWVMWECTRLVFILLCSLLCSFFLSSNIKQPCWKRYWHKTVTSATNSSLLCWRIKNSDCSVSCLPLSL